MSNGTFDSDMASVRQWLGDAKPAAREAAAFLAQVEREAWLPYPLAPLLSAAAARRDQAESFVLHAIRFFEASYRFLSALVVPVAVRQAQLPHGLVDRLRRWLGRGAASEAGHARLSMGDERAVFVSALEACLTDPRTLAHLPSFLQDFARPERIAELRRLHDAAVMLRNAAVHPLSGPSQPPVEEIASLLESALLHWVADLEPLRHFTLVTTSPPRIVQADGTFADLSHGALNERLRRPGSFLLRWNSLGAVREARPMAPLVEYASVGERAECLVPLGGAQGTAYVRLVPDPTPAPPPSDHARRELQSLVDVFVARADRDPSARIESFRAAFDAHFEGHARVLAVPRRPVETFDLGEYEAPPDVAARAAVLRPKLRINDPHALVDGPIALDHEPICLNYVRCDYATVQALRETGARPAALSASAVLVLPPDALLVHMRAPGSATYPNCLHTIGGAFQPNSRDTIFEDALVREIYEESKVLVEHGDWPVVLTEEVTTGFVQYVALGVRAARDRREANWEGRLRAVPFHALEQELVTQRRWVPSGKLHILLWLAAGAPGAPGATFGRHDAASLLRTVLETAPRDFAVPVFR